VEYLRDLLLIRMGNVRQLNVTRDALNVMAPHSQKLQTPELLQVIRVFNAAAGSEGRNPWQPSLPLEMAFVEALETLSGGVQHTPPSGSAAIDRSASPPARKQEKPASRPAPVEADRNPAAAHAAPAAGRQTHGEEPPAAGDPQASDDLPAADPQLNKRLSDNWSKILAQVRAENNAAYGALNSAKARTFSGNTLMISFASDVIRSKVDRPEVVELLKQAMQAIFEREVDVVFRVDTSRRDTVPPGVDDNGIVATAVRDLGGELVDIN
jgi:hypothetical protein